jgi:Uma2 family endonuclease
MLTTARRKKIHIGPEDNGRRMSLDDFDRTEVKEGYLYELGKGLVEVSNITALSHGQQVQELRQQIAMYRAANPDVIFYASEGSDAKLLIAPSQSERHPDMLLYLTHAPDVKDIWSIWVPEVVIEIVSPSSLKRDYQDKPDEYLEFGVDEYWIIDAPKCHLTALTRWRGQWKKQIAAQQYSTRLLPGLILDIKRIIAAAKVK